MAELIMHPRMPHYANRTWLTEKCRFRACPWDVKLSRRPGSDSGGLGPLTGRIPLSGLPGIGPRDSRGLVERLAVEEA